MSMKNSNDTIGNRTHHLPACSAVPQPTAPPRAPNAKVLAVIFERNISKFSLFFFKWEWNLTLAFQWYSGAIPAIPGKWPLWIQIKWIFLLEKIREFRNSRAVIVSYTFKSRRLSLCTASFNIQKFCVLHKLHLCVLRGSQNKQRFFSPYTALTYRFL